MKYAVHTTYRIGTSALVCAQIIHEQAIIITAHTCSAAWDHDRWF